MAEPKFTMTADDDLPRTFRREKEAREREAREREAGHSTPEQAPENSDYGYADESYEADTVAVRYLQIPFLHLTLFFMKAVFAAIPALILLGAVLYGLGQLLKAYFPWLIQAEILIRLPNG